MVHAYFTQYYAIFLKFNLHFTLGVALDNEFFTLGDNFRFGCGSNFTLLAELFWVNWGIEVLLRLGNAIVPLFQRLGSLFPFSGPCPRFAARTRKRAAFYKWRFRFSSGLFLWLLACTTTSWPWPGFGDWFLSDSDWFGLHFCYKRSLFTVRAERKLVWFEANPLLLHMLLHANVPTINYLLKICVRPRWC